MEIVRVMYIAAGHKAKSPPPPILSPTFTILFCNCLNSLKLSTKHGRWSTEPNMVASKKTEAISQIPIKTQNSKRDVMTNNHMEHVLLAHSLPPPVPSNHHLTISFFPYKINQQQIINNINHQSCGSSLGFWGRLSLPALQQHAAAIVRRDGRARRGMQRPHVTSVGDQLVSVMCASPPQQGIAPVSRGRRHQKDAHDGKERRM
jgi:hypothetical protein